MSTHYGLDDEQAYWLRRVLEMRPKARVLDSFTIPSPVSAALIAKGFIRWRRRMVEITLDGIDAIARYKPFREADASRSRLP